MPTSEHFRDYLPYHKTVTTVPIVVVDDSPIFTSMSTLNIVDDLPEGEYVVTISWGWSMPDTNDLAYFRAISPVLQDTIYAKEPKDQNEKEFLSILLPVHWAGGPISFEIEASKSSGAADLTISQSSIEFECKTRPTP